MKSLTRFALSTLFFWVMTYSLPAQDTLSTLTIDDYDTWERLGWPTLSDDGSWVAYEVSLQNENDTLRLRSTTTEKSYRFALGSNPQFSSDSKWAAFRIGYTEKEREQMQQKKQPVEYKMKLLRLESGEEELFEGINRYQFSDDAKHLVMETYAPKDSKLKSKDIILRNLESGTTRNIGNVAEWAFNEKGDFLAYAVSAEKKRGNGVELFDLRSYQVQVLASDTSIFRQLSWEEEEGEALVFLQAYPDTSFEEDNHRIHAFSGIYDDNPEHLTFDPARHEDFPDSMRIKETYQPIWSEDLQRIFVGIYEWEPAPPKPKKENKKEEEKVPDMEIWHWQDDPIIPEQRKTFQRDKNFTYLSVWNIGSDRFIQLADEKARRADITGDHRHVVLEDRTRYQPQYRLEHADYYLADAQTGKRNLVLENFPTNYFYDASPDGKYLYYFLDKNWHTYDTRSGDHVNLTEGLDTDFWNVRYDGPRDKLPPAGRAGWMKEDAELLIYDEYDIWAFRPDGSSHRKITSGREQENIYRFVRTDYEETYIDPEQPVFFRIFGDKTKKSGYVRMVNGKLTDQVFEDRLLSRLRKAKDADRYVYSKESYINSPDLFFADGSLKPSKQLSNTNPQQSEYAWGKTELIDFKNTDGKELQGVLHYPADYEPGKQYPMIVYIYEIRSNSLNNYVAPSNRRAYNLTHYVQNGYFVFQPDIVYKTNHPGESAVECVLPAVDEVVSRGFIDPDRIGLMGHSWGGYQTAFLITQTDKFAAAVAGAPLTNMISMYNSIYWNTGTPDQQIFETSQGRLREPFWDLQEEYIANSPVFQARNITTPVLVTFGDEDGAVDWHQGIEMYITMRRLAKPMILLVYDGENHGLRKKENQIDYFNKVTAFFDHHLRGHEPEKWITEGQSYLKKMEREEKNK